MTYNADNRTRKVIAANYLCRCCGHDQVRRYFSVKDYEQDIMGQNLLCMRCYLEGKYDPGSLVPHEQLPVTPYPTAAPSQIANEKE